MWIPRLRIVLTFLLHKIFLFPIIGTDLVNRAESWDIKNLVQFPGNSALKTLLRILNCVGCVHMRGRFIFKVNQSAQLLRLINFIYLIRDSYLISRQPKQFQPPLFSIFGWFFIGNPLFSAALCDDIGIKRCRISCASFDICDKFIASCPLIPTPTQKFKSWFSIFSSQGIGSRLVSFQVIFEALLPELFRFEFHSLGKKSRNLT